MTFVESAPVLNQHYAELTDTDPPQPRSVLLSHEGSVPAVDFPAETAHLIAVGDAQAGKTTAMDGIADGVAEFTGLPAYPGKYENSRLLRAAAFLADADAASPRAPVDETVQAYADRVLNAPKADRPDIVEQLQITISKGDETLRSPGADRLVRHLAQHPALRDYLEEIGVDILSDLVDNGAGLLVVNGRVVETLDTMARHAGSQLLLGTVILECSPETAAQRKAPHASPEQHAKLAADLADRNHHDRTRTDVPPATTRHTAKVIEVVDELPGDTPELDAFGWHLGGQLFAASQDTTDAAVVIDTEGRGVNPKPEQRFLRALTLGGLHAGARRR